MSTKRFKFVSPGVFLNEIDNSRVPAVLDAVGPTIIGRTRKGPGMIPLTVNSMAEYVEVFGEPVPGGRSDEVYRDGNLVSPQYAGFAAQAFLRNSGPINVVRLLGTKDTNATAAGVAGWKLQGSRTFSTHNGQAKGLPSSTDSAVYGLYLFSTGGIDPRQGYRQGGAGTYNTVAATSKTTLTGTLAAVWYMENSAIILSGNLARLDADATSARLQGSTQGATFTITVTHEANTLEADDRITITTSKNSTIILNCNLNTPTAGAVDSLSGNQTINFDRQGLADAGSTNEHIAASIADVLKKHDEVQDATSTAGGVVTVTMSNEGTTTVAASNTTGNAMAVSAVSTAAAADRVNAAVTGSNVLVESTNAGTFEFVAYVYDKGSDQNADADVAAKNERTSGITAGRKVVFNFDRNSDKYIRKVFNTNPMLLNSETTQDDAVEKYWLGETFDRFVKDHHGRGSDNKLHQGVLGTPAAGGLCAALIPLHAQSDNPYDDRTVSHQDSVTNWIVSQDVTADSNGYQVNKMQKLFKFCGINDGGWNTRHTKISITDLKLGTEVDPYGTFTVLVRRIDDNDGRQVVLERFSQCSLNPNSKNYIARKVGDQYREWDEADGRYRIYGEFPNQSSLFRVETHQDLQGGVLDPSLLPFGFYGAPRIKTGVFQTNSAQKDSVGLRGHAMCEASDVAIDIDGTYSGGFRPIGGHTGVNSFGIFGLPAGATGSLLYPTLPLRLTSSAEGLSNPKKSCFGVSTYRSPTDTRFDESFYDTTRRLGRAYVSTDKSTATTNAEISQYFSLDDLIAFSKTGSAPDISGLAQGGLLAKDIGGFVYVSGSRRTGVSYTAINSSYKELVKSGFANFTVPVYGGFDGFDVKEKDPVSNQAMSGDETTSYEIATLKRALDTVADPEVIEMNALVAPGITNTRITNQMIRVCEDRADALAIIDIEDGGYIPDTEAKTSFKTRIQDSKPREAIANLEQRGLNSSYACAFYPWVKVVDSFSDQQLWAPPSVAALGTFASTEASSELWFAPAGFTRGGLSEGAAGIPVLAVSQRVSSKERDELYEANINPIAQFPAEGIVVFGQKTLQVTPSALDRINVRRLMIFVKKEISRIAARLLFEQNVQATWDRFRGQVEPFLDSVKSRFGLTDFKVILDSTTTTPDLIDRNIMYAKIFLKPARSIEFIAIDFVITNSGASFEE